MKMNKKERLKYIRRALKIMKEIDEYQKTSDPTGLSPEAIKRIKTKPYWNGKELKNWHF